MMVEILRVGWASRRINSLPKLHLSWDLGAYVSAYIWTAHPRNRTMSAPLLPDRITPLTQAQFSETYGTHSQYTSRNSGFIPRRRFPHLLYVFASNLWHFSSPSELSLPPFHVSRLTDIPRCTCIIWTIRATVNGLKLWFATSSCNFLL
jgi:hypothetical protein